MITKSPENRDHCLKHQWFFNAARSSFSFLLESLKFEKGEKLLLPAYIGITDREGSGVMDPIWSNGVEFEFYRVDRQLNAVVEDIERATATFNVKAILLIHYFGFPQRDLESVAALSDAHGLVLIEDCAHALFSRFNNKPLGSRGAFSFFSIHKSAPTSAGGFLVVNNRDLLPSREIDPLHRIGQGDLETFARLDRTRIVNRRRSNYEFLVRELADCPHLDLMQPQLDAGVVPLNFPMVIKGGAREKLYFHLMDLGMPTIALYYRLIEELGRAEFSDSEFVSKNILNLPVHQDVGTEDLSRLVGAIKSYLQLT